MKVPDQERILGVIERLRLEGGLGYEQIAEAMGISSVTLVKRRREGGWLAKELAAVSNMAGCSMDEFVKEVGDAADVPVRQ